MTKDSDKTFFEIQQVLNKYQLGEYGHRILIRSLHNDENIHISFHFIGNGIDMYGSNHFGVNENIQSINEFYYQWEYNGNEDTNFQDSDLYQEKLEIICTEGNENIIIDVLEDAIRDAMNYDDYIEDAIYSDRVRVEKLQNLANQRIAKNIQDFAKYRSEDAKLIESGLIRKRSNNRHSRRTNDFINPGNIYEVAKTNKITIMVDTSNSVDVKTVKMVEDTVRQMQSENGNIEMVEYTSQLTQVPDKEFIYNRGNTNLARAFKELNSDNDVLVISDFEDQSLSEIKNFKHVIGLINTDMDHRQNAKYARDTLSLSNNHIELYLI